MLKQQVVQLKGLQVAAEKEADAVMTQLEDFINEQEKMVSDENCSEEGEGSVAGQMELDADGRVGSEGDGQAAENEIPAL